VPDLNVTLVQAELAWQDPEGNRQQFAGLLGNLRGDTDLVILPEMFNTGFTMDTAAQAEEMGGETIAWMAEQARCLDVTLCGSLIVSAGGQYYNRCIWMPPDGHLSFYDKRHLFRMAGEHEHFAAGSERLVVALKGWRVCPLVCYDLRFPVWSRGTLDFDLLLYVANWPTARRSAWRALLPARAVENQCYAAGVNRIGADGRRVAYAGDSLVADPFGNLLADLGDAPGIVTVRLERDSLDRYREKFPAWRDADRFALLPT
jgi:omega-amidase